MHYTYGGLCQQQGESAFQLISLGHSKSKQECYNKCCKKEGCHVSLVTGKNCFGIRCEHSDLCKAIVEQLSNFEGHRVDKRSLLDHHQHISNAKSGHKSGIILILCII